MGAPAALALVEFEAVLLPLVVLVVVVLALFFDALVMVLELCVVVVLAATVVVLLLIVEKLNVELDSVLVCVTTTGMTVPVEVIVVVDVQDVVTPDDVVSWPKSVSVFVVVNVVGVGEG